MGGVVRISVVVVVVVGIVIVGFVIVVLVVVIAIIIVGIVFVVVDSRYRRGRWYCFGCRRRCCFEVGTVIVSLFGPRLLCCCCQRDC